MNRFYLLLLLINTVFYLPSAGQSSVDYFTQYGQDLNGSSTSDGANLGKSISLSDNGDYMVIGMPGYQLSGSWYDQGTALIYHFNGTSWDLEAGYSAEIRGEIAGANFGSSVAISGNGTIVAIGAPNPTPGPNGDDGYVRIFERSGTSWLFRQEIRGSNVSGHLNFGESLAVNQDGSRIAVGSRNNTITGTADQGEVRVFQRDFNSWNQLGSPVGGQYASGFFGRSLDISNDGNVFVSGGPHANDVGVVQIFQWNGNNWVQRGSSIFGSTTNEQFGHDVALSGDGNMICIGARSNSDLISSGGRVIAFEYINTAWSQLGQSIYGSQSGGQFGGAVDVSADGTRIAVGALFNGVQNHGAVTIYEFDSGTWNSLAGDFYGANPHDYFGSSVGISSNGNRIVVGAYGNDDSGNNMGEVQGFELKTMGFFGLSDLNLTCGQEEILTIDGYNIESATWTPSLGLNTNVGLEVTASPNETTQYNVVMVATGSPSTILVDSIIITVNPNPVSANISTPSIVCGGSAFLEATLPEFVSGTSYSWSPSSSLDNANVFDPVASPSNTTLYEVTATTPNGCISTDQISVQVIDNNVTLSASQMNISCGTPIQLNAIVDFHSDNFEYSWYDGLSYTSTASNVLNITPGQTTTYQVTATSANGCSVTDQITINVDNPNPPNPGIYSSSGNYFLCDNGLTLSAATGFSSYAWSTGSSSQTTTVDQSGWYSVQVINSAGCAGIDSVEVVPMTEITTPGGTVLCQGQTGQTLLLDAGSGFTSYLWSTGEQTQTIEVNSVGIYTCTVSLNNCEYSAQIEVTQNSGTATVDFVPDINGLSVNFILSGNGISFVAWDFGDGNTSSELNPTHIYSQEGTYTVEVSMTDVCGNSATHSETISVTAISVNELNELEFKVFPNPSSGSFRIELEQPVNQQLSLIVTGLFGKKLVETVIQKGSSNLDVHLKGLSNGLYLLNVIYDERITRKKVQIIN